MKLEALIYIGFIPPSSGTNRTDNHPVELSVVNRQCLNRRLPDQNTL